MKPIEYAVKEVSLSDWIFQLFKNYYRGRHHPIKRAELLYHVCQQSQTTDREMRQAYEDLPICGSSRGLYLPETKAEIDEQIALHMKKIYSYFRKIKVLRQYKIESDAVQKELF